MKKTFVKWSTAALLVTGLAGVAWAAGGHAMGHGGGCRMMSDHQAKRHSTMQPAKSHPALNVVGEISAYLQSAQKAVDAGDTKVAADELVKAQKALASLKEQLESCPMMAPAGRPANTRCPIMGGKIDPAGVKPELTRHFKGRTIAFCCGGCPAQWDKLGDQQKQAKLDAHTPVEQMKEPKADPHGGHQH